MKAREGTNIIDLDFLGAEPAPVKRRPFQPWTVQEIRNQRDLSFLVGNAKAPIMGEGALWQTFGARKSAKTMFTLDLCFCIAFGIPFHGFEVKSGVVIYVLAEGGIKRNFQRVEALGIKYAADLKERGYATIDEAMASGRLILIDQAIGLALDAQDAPTAPDEFVREIKERNGITEPVIIVLDTWARMLWESGGHDSAQEKVGPSVQAAERIRRELGTDGSPCTLVMVAHSGVAAKDRAKGLTDPATAIDGGMMCTKTGKGAAARYVYETIDQRHGTEGFKLTFKMVQPEGYPAPVLEPVDGADARLAKIKLSDGARAWFEVLRSAAGGLSEEAWLTAGQVAGLGEGNAPKSVRKALQRAVAALKVKDLIEQDADVYIVREEVSASAEFASEPEENEA